MTKKHIKLTALWTRPLPVGRFNQMVDAVNNKAAVLFSLISQLIYQAFKKHSRQNLQIVIDKQSGRKHYRKPLQQMFPELKLKILKEEPSTSSYQLSDSSHSMKVHFLEKGEQRQLPIALASMTSKYLRELFMEMLNAYFQKHLPDIPPTAGYYQDGRRFLNDLKSKNLDPALAPLHLLVRNR